MTDKRIAYGGEIKSLKNGTVSGYLVRFTDETERDLYGEYFDAATNFHIADHPVVGKPVMYNHGMDDMFGVRSLGTFTKFEVREGGLWVEATLKELDDYMRMLEETNEEANRRFGRGLGWSSGALPQSVDVNERTGHIKSWAIIEGSLTFTPADPANRIKTLNDLRSLLKEHPAKEAISTQDNNTLSYTWNDTATTTVTSADGYTVTIVPPNSSPQGDKRMSDNAAFKMSEEDEKKVRDIVREIVKEIMDKNKSELRADDMEEDDEEMQRAVDAAVERNFANILKTLDVAQEKNTDAVQRIVERHFSNDLLKTAVESLFADREKRAAEQKSIIETAKANAAKNAPGVSKTEAAGGYSNDNSQRIEVGESLKYAHLDAVAMALGVKLALAQIPEWQRRGKTLGWLSDNGILTEDFTRSLAHKSASAWKAWKPRTDALSITDHAAVRSALPSAIRADELHASNIAGQGLEWVELFYDAMIWERARDRTELFNRLVSKGMEVETIPEGASGMNVKLDTASGTVYTMPQGNDLDAQGNSETVVGFSQFGTSEIEVTPSTHVLAHSVTYVLEEDSIIRILSWLPNDMLTTLAESLESTIINGDTTTSASSNINLIDGTPAGGLNTPDYIAWDGIRHQFLVDNTSFARSASGVGITMLDFSATKKLMPSAIKNRTANMLWVYDDNTESNIRMLPELLTPGVAAQGATIYAGDIPRILGVDPYMSGFMNASNTAGKISVTSGNNLYGTLALIYALYWKYGRKRNIMFEQDRHARAQATEFVATIRHAFKARGAGAAAGTYYLGA